jgi:hypothetical protein
MKHYWFASATLVFICLFFGMTDSGLAQSILLYEGFESPAAPGLPTGWTTTTNRRPTGDWFDTTLAGVGAQIAYCINPTIAQRLTTPVINFTGYIADSVTLQARRSGTFDTGLDLEVSTDGGTSWTLVGTATPPNVLTRLAFKIPSLVNGKPSVTFRYGQGGTGTGTGGTTRLDEFTVTAFGTTINDGDGTASLQNAAGTFANSSVFDRASAGQTVRVTVVGVPSGTLDKVKLTVPGGWTGFSGANITLGGEFSGKTPTVVSNDITINSAALQDTGGTITITSLTSPNPVGPLLTGNDTWIVQTAKALGTLTTIDVPPVSYTTIPIQNIRTGGVDGFGNTSASGDTSAMSNATVALKGVATVDNGIISSILTQTSFFIQESGYGVQVFRSAAPVTTFIRGDQIVVKGVISTFRGSTEIVPASGAGPDFFNLGPASLPAPSVIANAAAIRESNEGKLVRLNSVSFDSAGQSFVASVSGRGANNFRTTPSDTGSLFLSSTNTLTGNSIPVTADIIGIVYHRNDIVGPGQPPHKISPRDQVDIGQNAADGSGTAAIRPTARLSSQPAIAETVTVTAGAFTLTSVSVEIPSSWTWNGSSRTLSGAGFSGAASSVTGNGSAGTPWIITITGASLSGANTGSLNIQNLGTPPTLGPTTFTTKSAGSGGSLTALGTSPVVTIATAFEAGQSGNWSNPATWTGGVVPGASDDVSMSTLGVTVTVDIANAQCNGLTMTGSGSAVGSGPLLQFQAAGVLQLTVNGPLSITGGTGAGGNDRGGRPKLTSNGNAAATLVLKKTLYVTSSNSVANGDAGMNMNEGTVKMIGTAQDSIRNGAGLRLGNLQVGDGAVPKTIYTVPGVSSSTLSIRSLVVKQGSTFWIGAGATTNVLTIGNAFTAGVPTLNGGIVVETGAALKVQESSAGFVLSTINLDGGGITNNGTIDLVSPAVTELTGCVYDLRVGGNPAGTSGVTQAIGGTAVGEFADVSIDSGHTLTLNQGMNVAGGHKLTVYNGTLAETAGNTVIGVAEATRTLVQSVNESFGGLGLEINAAGGAPGATVVSRRTGTAVTSGSSASILRWFDIAPANNSALNATLNVFYDNSELNGNNANVLKLYKSTDAGGTWSNQGGAANAGLRRIQLTGVPSFSRWTAADTSNPLGTSTINVGLTAGWNMISNPMITANDSVRQVFPTSSFPYAFAFVPASGYQQRYRMDRGVGYWAKFPAPGTNPLGGTPRTSDSIAVAAGWNMIGSIGTSVDTSAISTVPPGIRSSQYFGYSGGYSAAQTIVPGKGYWVKATAPGTLLLSAGPAPSRRASANLLENFGTLTVADGEGASQTLYLGEDRDGTFPVEFYDMPPAGPDGAFDVRFSSGRIVETYASRSGENSVHTLNLSGVSVPVTISWQLPAGSNRVFRINDGNTEKRMTSSGSLTLTNPAVRRLTVSTIGSELPAEFSLGQNYPNPFNPSTSIRFGLPVESQVSVRVFNLLGQQVAEIAGGMLKAGYHEVTWEGRTNLGVSVCSGIYFCKLEAVAVDGGRSFSDIRKMMLLK